MPNITIADTSTDKTLLYVVMDSSEVHEAKYLPDKCESDMLTCAYDIYTQNRAKGYPNFSIDTFYENDDTTYFHIFFGPIIQHTIVNYHADSVASGIVPSPQNFKIATQNLEWTLDSIGKSTHVKLNNEGFILNRVVMDSFKYEDNTLQIYNGIYAFHRLKLDSLRLTGKLVINYRLLTKLAQFDNDQYFYPRTLKSIENNLNQINFIKLDQAPSMAVHDDLVDIELKAENRGFNQADVVIGIQPNDVETGKLLLTGNANLKLINSFSRAETFEFSWQQLQAQSPRLKALIDMPYIALSDFGFTADLNYFRKDSSFRNLHTGISGNYIFAPTHVFSLYFQTDDARTITVDTNQIKNSSFKMDYLDYNKKAYGLLYQRSKKDRIINPTKGFSLKFDISTRNRKIVRDPLIENLTNSQGLSYSQLYDSLENNRWQSSLFTTADLLSPVSKTLVWYNQVKLHYLTGKDMFKNEMLQIGGFQTLKGFDEQSLFVKNYSLLFTEIRYLLGLNGYISIFANSAYINRYYTEGNQYELKNGIGLGLNIQTSGGNFGLQYAIGSGESSTIDFRTGKIHLGYISTF